MKTLIPILTFFFFCPNTIFAQVGIGNTNPQATVDISATSLTTPTNEDGILIPRIDEFPASNPSAAQDGMLVFVTGNGTPSEGFYYWDNGTTAWIPLDGTKNSLDAAYDEGGAGAGRIITADNGTIEILDTGGLRVEGDITAAEYIVHDSDANTFVRFLDDRLVINAGGINYFDIDDANQEVTVNENSNAVDFRVESDNETHMLLVDGVNNAIGIGDNNPLSPIQIGIETPFDLNVANTGQDGIFIIGNNATGLDEIGGSISFGGAHPARKDSRRAAISSVQTGIDEDNVGLAFYIHRGPINTEPMFEGMRLTHQRYLGINNTSPDATLDVVGTMQFVDGNEAAGYVLSSDASGNATWTDPSILGDDDWNISGTFIDSGTRDVYIGPNGAANTDLFISGDIIDQDSVLHFVDPNSITHFFELQMDDGSNADPAINFYGDNDTGFYRPESGAVGISTNGTDKFRFTPQGQLEFYNTGSSVFLGEEAGQNDDLSGRQNIAIGYRALRANVSGARNIAIGSSALLLNTGGSTNVAIGDDAMAVSTSGSNNISIGTQTLFRNTSGGNNVAVGGTSLRENLTGSNNTALGYRALYNTTTNANVAIGYETGLTNVSGIRNTFIGTGAGHLTTGSSNVMLGYNAGYNETGANKLYIENSNSATPLIYGEFDSNILRTYGTFQINDPAGAGYAFPTNDGANGQVLTTDGAGNVSFQTVAGDGTGTDDQTIDTFSFNTSTNVLTLEIENDGIAAQTVDLSSLQDGTGNDWSLSGNVGLGSSFIGTTNNSDLRFRTNNTEKLRLSTQGQLEFYNSGQSVFIGELAGENDDLSNNFNTFIGYRAGTNSTTGFYNTALGHNSLLSNTTGSRNLALGSGSLLGNTTGFDNIAIGSATMVTNTTESYNIAIGYGALFIKDGGNSNIAIGYRAGAKDETSNQNVYIGYEAGGGFIPDPNENKSGNIFIGYRAGYNESGSNKLYLENSNTTQPLIYGTFDTNEVGINWDSTVALPNTLSVNGEASKATAGSWAANSDRRLKKNIQTISGETALDKLLKMRGVTYLWNDSQTGIERPEGIQYGFIAQEIMELFPEKVTKDPLGFYQTSYGDYDPIFVEAFKEQQQQIDALRSQVAGLEAENELLKESLQKQTKLEERLSALEALIEKNENSVEASTERK